MSDYGDGSDGTLNVTSGTTNLNLDTIYQYTTVNVSSGAILQATGAGSVLYIQASESVTIDGEILAYTSTKGQNNYSIVINDETYSNPSCAQGGYGSIISVANSYGTPELGYGSGGSGGTSNVSNTSGVGGNGGSGNSSGIAGGSSFSGSGGGYKSGNAGVNSGGGSGGAYAASSYSYTTGAGGSTYGGNGSNGSVSSIGSVNVAAGGGGGAGGAPGNPGAHIYISSPSITFSGSIYTIGQTNKNGQNGGNGGYGYVTGSSAKQPAGGGGGGGGGNAGNLYLNYESIDYAGKVWNSGGYGGRGGLGGASFQGANGYPGSNGSAGTVFLNGLELTTNNNLIFSSSWDIDQLVESGTVNIGSGVTELYDFSSSTLPDFPVTEVQFQPTGSSQWFVPGESSTDGTTGNAFSFYFYVQNQKLYINAPETSKARYFIWSDKVNY